MRWPSHRLAVPLFGIRHSPQCYKYLPTQLASIEKGQLAHWGYPVFFKDLMHPLHLLLLFLQPRNVMSVNYDEYSRIGSKRSRFLVAKRVKDRFVRRGVCNGQPPTTCPTTKAVSICIQNLQAIRTVGFHRLLVCVEMRG